MKAKTRFDRGIDIAFRWMLAILVMTIALAVAALMYAQTHGGV